MNNFSRNSLNTKRYGRNGDHRILSASPRREKAVSPASITNKSINLDAKSPTNKSNNKTLATVRVKSGSKSKKRGKKNYLYED